MSENCPKSDKCEGFCHKVDDFHNTVLSQGLPYPTNRSVFQVWLPLSSQ